MLLRKLYLENILQNSWKLHTVRAQVVCRLQISDIQNISSHLRWEPSHSLLYPISGTTVKSRGCPICTFLAERSLGTQGRSPVLTLRRNRSKKCRFYRTTTTTTTTAAVTTVREPPLQMLATVMTRDDTTPKIGHHRQNTSRAHEGMYVC